ncbi:MAG: ABC transporter ATP-binding protein [Melioribacter sp.]|uniref:ABC transporter ATP-binding protein n=1 Tax=Rosettibacter primus TaxID=3111523 RepID=UPI00247E9B81|nr:ABC transporter ATP-binding protein [Melioribacter sp.]
MTEYSLQIENLVKYFGRRLVFNGINASFKSKNIYGIAGPNGSGKSTFVKIIANLISPTRGKVTHKNEDEIITGEKLHNYIGFVSPYLFLYDEFTAEENLIYFSKIRGINFNKDYSDYLLLQMNLIDRRNDLVRGYSSGMKQRLKFIFALLHKPRLIILDEPTSNLDNFGKDKVYELISKEGEENLIVIASNELDDLKLCSQILNLEDYKNKNE